MSGTRRQSSAPYCTPISSTSIEYPGIFSVNSLAAFTVLSTGTTRFGSLIEFVAAVDPPVSRTSFAAGFTAFAFSYAFDRIDAFVTSCDLGVPSGRLDIDRAPPDPEGDARRVAAVARRFLADAGVAPASLGAVLPPQHDRAFIAALRAELAAGPDPVTATLIDATAGRNDLADSGLAAAWTATSPGAPAAQGGGPRLLISLSAGLQIGCALHAG